MYKSSTILQKAHWFIARNDWTYSTMARDKFGDPVATSSPDAVSFCAAGAVMRAEAYYSTHNPLGTCQHVDDVIVYNDCYVTSREEALAWFDKAIAMAKAAGD